jgi:hypothetical protein
VVAGRALGDPELVGNLAVGEALGDEVRYLLLAAGKLAHRFVGKGTWTARTSPRRKRPRRCSSGIPATRTVLTAQTTTESPARACLRGQVTAAATSSWPCATAVAQLEGDVGSLPRQTGDPPNLLVS